MKLTKKIYIFWHKYAWEENGEFQVWDVKLDDDGERIFVAEQEIEIDIPEGFDPRPHQVSALEVKKQQVIATAQAAVAHIEEQISSLKAISYEMPC